MRPALDTPRGARFLTPALFTRPSSALVRVGRAPVARLEPHRLCLAVLSMVSARSPMRCLRGVARVAADATATLAPLTVEAAAHARQVADRLHDAVEELDAPDRVPVLLCVAYALHETAPTGEVWQDVARAIDALHRGAESVETRAAARERREPRVVIRAGHQRIAAAIVAEVLA